MGNKQSSAQINFRQTNIGSGNHNLRIEDNGSVTFTSTHIIAVAGAALISILVVSLIFSCILNCYFCRRLRRRNGFLSVPQRVYKESGSASDLFIKSNVQSLASCKKTRESPHYNV
uniref:Non-structural protein 1 peptide 2 n=1 Tax=Rotavirus B TaxID=28876 RepID=A0A3G1DLM7_9REOV|nr:non-structural protein 1 peptide 2 [Rotavirus B]